MVLDLSRVIRGPVGGALAATVVCGIAFAIYVSQRPGSSSAPERQAVLAVALSVKNKAAAGITPAEISPLAADVGTRADVAVAAGAVSGAEAAEAHDLARALLLTKRLWIEQMDEPPCSQAYYKLGSSYIFTDPTHERYRQDCQEQIRAALVEIGAAADVAASMVKGNNVFPDILVGSCLGFVAQRAQRLAQRLSP